MRKAIDYFLTEIEMVDELPEAVRAAVLEVTPEASIGAIVTIPPQENRIEQGKWWQRLPFLIHVTPRRTIVMSAEQVIVIEVDGEGALNRIVIPIENLIEIDLTVVLLYGILKLAWIAEADVRSLQILFNTVGERILRKQLGWLRAQIVRRAPSHTYPYRDQPAVSAAAFPLKFRNYLTLSLAPGECARAALMQPAIYRTFGRLRRALSPNRLIAITDDFLVLIDEERPFRYMNYGMSMRYRPLHAIRQIDLEAGAEATWLKLAMPDEVHVSALPLHADTAEALMRQLQSCLASQANMGT
jgi:hypothetical protein